MKKTTKPKINKQEKIIKGVEDKMTLPQLESQIKKSASTVKKSAAKMNKLYTKK
jgi:hypothetical protein